MKRSFLFAVVSILAFGCNNSPEATSGISDTTKMSAAKTEPAEQLDYPYQLQKPYDDWQPGDKKLAVTAMKALKAWETNNIAECVTYFGDTTDIRFDYLRKRLPHDSLAAFFTSGRNDYGNVSVQMYDWESVVSKDNATRYVTMWYKQVFTDKKGKTDSLAVVDDCKMVNGKIVELDEKIQHYPAKK